MSKRERDSQRSKFWSAVGSVQVGPKSDLGPAGRQELYDRIKRDKWIRKTYPRWYPNWAAPKRNANKAYLLLNAVAYEITGEQYGSHVAWHGWQHAQVYMDLVRRVYGRDKAEAVKAAYKRCKVRFRPKKKRAPTGLAVPGVMPEAFKANLERVREKARAGLTKKAAAETEQRNQMFTRAPVLDALSGLLQNEATT